MVSTFPKKHPPNSTIECFDGGRTAVPGAFGGPSIRVPFHRLESLSVVLPIRIDHAQSAVPGAVAHEVLDIGDSYTHVRQNTAPVAHAGTNEKLVSRFRERQNLAFEAR